MIDHVRRLGRVPSLQLAYVPGPGTPEPFYRGLGFVPAGRIGEGEVEMSLRLDGS